MTFESFATLEEMFARMDEQRQAADAHIQPWQAAVKPGDCFLRTDQPVLIYGQVLPPPRQDRKRYEQEHLRDFRLTRCFSVLCPEGEVGDTHISCFTRLLTPEEFAAAQANDWPEPTEEEALGEDDLHPLYFCPRHSPSLGLFAADPHHPTRLVCGCSRRRARRAGWE